MQQAHMISLPLSTCKQANEGLADSRLWEALIQYTLPQLDAPRLGHLRATCHDMCALLDSDIVTSIWSSAAGHLLPSSQLQAWHPGSSIAAFSTPTSVST